MVSDRVLTVKIDSPGGEGVLRIDASHPLAGPMRVGLLKGRPPGKWGYLAVQAGPRANVLGAFVHTDGNRLLFFPGANTYMNGAQAGLRDEEYLIDHLTLEGPDGRGRYPSHVTLRARGGSVEHGGGWSTKAPTGWLVPWFTLLVPGLRDFHPLPQTLLIDFESERSDLKQFGEQLLGRMSSVLVPMPAATDPPNYLQIDAWAGRWIGWETARTQVVPWAYKGLVQGAPSAGRELDIANVKAHFAAETGVMVLVCMPTGTVDHPQILRMRVPAARNESSVDRAGTTE